MSDPITFFFNIQKTCLVYFFMSKENTIFCKVSLSYKNKYIYQSKMIVPTISKHTFALIFMCSFIFVRYTR